MTRQDSRYGFGCHSEKITSPDTGIEIRNLARMKTPTQTPTLAEIKIYSKSPPMRLNQYARQSILKLSLKWLLSL